MAQCMSMALRLRQVSASGLTVVDSGCKTLLVCFAEEPQVLHRRKRELAEHLEQASRLGRDKNSSSLIAP